MAELSRAKSVQLTLTGVLLVLFSSGLFGLLYIIHDNAYEFGTSNIFNRQTSFWVAIPITITGLIGVLAGISTKKFLVTLYLIASLVSTGLAGLVSVGYGLRVTDIRAGCGEDSSCKNSNTAVIIGTIVLLSAILLSISLLATAKSCQAKWGPSKNQRKKRPINPVRYTAKNAKTNGPPVPVMVIDSVPNGKGCHACGKLNVGATTENNDGEDNSSSSGYDTTNSTETNLAYASLQPTLSPKENDSQSRNSAKDDDSSLDNNSEVHGIPKSVETPKDASTCSETTVEIHESSKSDNAAKEESTTSNESAESRPDGDVKDAGSSQEPVKDDENNVYYVSMDENTEASPHYESLNEKTRNKNEATAVVQVNEAYEDDENLSTAL